MDWMRLPRTQWRCYLHCGAALDVLEREPTPADNPLLSMRTVIITPHTAWYSEESQQRLKGSAADEVRRAPLDEPPRRPLNQLGG